MEFKAKSAKEIRIAQNLREIKIYVKKVAKVHPEMTTAERTDPPVSSCGAARQKIGHKR